MIVAYVPGGGTDIAARALAPYVEKHLGAGARIVVANRTAAHAEELAERVGGRAISLEEIPHTLRTCDVLLASTGAQDLLLERSAFEEVMRERDGRAMLIVDVGVPRLR